MVFLVAKPEVAHLGGQLAQWPCKTTRQEEAHSNGQQEQQYT